MPRPNEPFMGSRAVFDRVQAIVWARQHGYRVEYYPNARKPIYITIRIDRHYPRHTVFIGYDDDGTYHVNSSLESEPLLGKYGLSSSEASKYVHQALSGHDISIGIDRRLGVNASS